VALNRYYLWEGDFRQLSLVPLSVANFRVADDPPGTSGRHIRALGVYRKCGLACSHIVAWTAEFAVRVFSFATMPTVL